jgi:hypothetical protein
MAEPPGQPLVTVGVPVLNGEALLERALRSIVEQTYPNLEIVVSDNGSTDGTAAIIEAFAARDPRFRCFRQASTIPALMNFKFVLEHATGEYFFWAPHDDSWNARYVELGVAALEKNPEASAVMGTVRYFNEHEQEILRYEPPYPLTDREVYPRLRKYLTNPVTDHLYYAMFRRRALLGTIWSKSTCPEKVVIMHALCMGPVIDGPGMTYFNRHVPKTPEELTRLFSFSSSDQKYQAAVFTDVVREIWRGTTFLDAARLLPLYFFSQNWHKFFAKWLLAKFGVNPR